MKRNYLFSLAISAFLSVVLLILPAQATFMVPSFGETGWQPYSYTSATGFTGTANWLVANTLDMAVDSVLLLDKVSQNSAGNLGFETGDYTGFDLGQGSGAAVVSSYTSNQGKVYLPTQGSYFSSQYTYYSYPYNDASAFTNYTGDAGTDGTFLSTPVTLSAGGKFSFNWAFLANDYTPFTDFAAFFLTDSTGKMLGYDVLAQIGPVASVTQVGVAATPITSSALLLGTGILGLVGLRRKFKHVS